MLTPGILAVPAPNGKGITMDTGQWIMAALGLALIMEGAGYALVGERIRELLIKMEPGTMRVMGILSMLTGLVILWMANRLFQ